MLAGARMAASASGGVFARRVAQVRRGDDAYRKIGGEAQESQRPPHRCPL
ncbi:hypothetical protein [Nonomuraea dietziae]